MAVHITSKPIVTAAEKPRDPRLKLLDATADDPPATQTELALALFDAERLLTTSDYIRSVVESGGKYVSQTARTATDAWDDFQQVGLPRIRDDHTMRNVMLAVLIIFLFTMLYAFRRMTR